MKRALVAFVGLGIALLICAMALGSVAHYRGHDRDPGCQALPTPKACEITFDGKKRHGRVIKVKNFQYRFIPMTTVCPDGLLATSSGRRGLSPIRVNRKRKFKAHEVIHHGKTKVEVHGRFTKDFHKASGQLLVKEGGVDGHGFTCDTGIDHYSADR
jgi:hypothetical protein